MHSIENMTYDLFFIFGFIAGVFSIALVRIIMEWREDKSSDLIEEKR